MPRRDVRAGRVLSEVTEVSNALEQTEAKTPFGAEEPGLDEVQVDLLPDARNLQVQAERLATAEEVLLLNLRGDDEAFER